MKDYTLEDWETEFRPMPNHLSKNASWQDEHGVGVLFETYGAELEFVMAQPNENVWTYTDTDSGTALCAGYHLVNRIGYLVCEVAREPEMEDMSNHICITVSTDAEVDN
jgi:hypothetical protein